MLSELDRHDTDTERNLLRDLKAFLRKQINDATRNIKPIILVDWNEECKGISNSQKLCDEFSLVDVWTSIYPEEVNFKTYLRWSQQIDFALALPETAASITNIMYEPFHYI